MYDPKERIIVIVDTKDVLAMERKGLEMVAPQPFEGLLIPLNRAERRGFKNEHDWDKRSRRCGF